MHSSDSRKAVLIDPKFAYRTNVIDNIIHDIVNYEINREFVLHAF